MSHNQRPVKRPRLEQQDQKFTDASQIRNALRSKTTADASKKSVIALRNQLTVKHFESNVAADDSRLLLAQKWLEDDPGAGDVFALWDEQRQLGATVMSLLAALLGLLTSHLTFHHFGHVILKTLFTTQYKSRINSCIGGNNADAILAALRLYNAMSNFASGKERSAVMESFPWELKSLPKLLTMRRRTDNGEYSDTMAKPDIRSLHLLLLTSFLLPNTPSHLKTTFLDSHFSALQAVFKGLHQDSYPLIRHVLNVFWEGLWLDNRVRRSHKIALFGEVTLGHLCKIFERIISDSPDPDEVPADLVYHFLLAICTRPGVGICFKDKGWYPRSVEETEEGRKGKAGGKIYNKILSVFLPQLKVTSDHRQADLAFQILSACPELVAPYFASSAASAGIGVGEPKLSSRFVNSVGFMGKVVGLPVPVDSFLLTEGPSPMYNPSPPPAHPVLQSIVPSSASATGVKANLSKALQPSAPALVRHCTALLLCKILSKYQEVLRCLDEASLSLGEDNHYDLFEEGPSTYADAERMRRGSWLQRKSDVEREIRARMPDWQVVVTFWSSAVPSVSTEQSEDVVQKGILEESALRLMTLYQRCLSGMVGEGSKFDIGKLLTPYYSPTMDAPIEDEGGVDAEEPQDRMQSLKQVHIFRLLQTHEEFDWTAKSAKGPTYFFILLSLFSSPSTSTGVRSILSELLTQFLSQTLLFQHVPTYVPILLDCLPSTRRTGHGKSPDGAKLTDERESVIKFLDDCVMRCIKTPYKYLEDLSSLQSSIEDPMGDGTLGVPEQSPLLAAIVEQLYHKVRGKDLLTASDILAIASFTRMLIFQLLLSSSSSSSSVVLKMLATKIHEALSIEVLPSSYPLVSKAIRREVAMMLAQFDHRVSRFEQSGEMNAKEHHSESFSVEDMVSQAEQIDVPSQLNSRIISAYEFIDYVRLTDQLLDSTNMKRLVKIVERFYSPAVDDLMLFLDPRQECLLWDSFDVMDRQMRYRINFSTLFLHVPWSSLKDPTCRQALLDAISPKTTEQELIICLRQTMNVIASLLRDTDDREICSALIHLVSGLVQMQNSREIKELIFGDSPSSLKSLCCQIHDNQDSIEAVAELVKTSLSSKDSLDREVIADVAAFWADHLRSTNDYGQLGLCSLPWIPFFSPQMIVELLRSQNRESSLTSPFLCALQQQQHAIAGTESLLCDNVSLLASLPPSPESQNLLVNALSSLLPLGHDGSIPSMSSFSDLLSLACSRWTRCTRQSFSDLRTLKWIDRADVIARMVYFRATSNVPTPLLDEKGAVMDLLPALHAFLDIAIVRGHTIQEEGFIKLISRLPKKLYGNVTSTETKMTISRCLKYATRVVSQPLLHPVVKALSKEIERSADDCVDSYTLEVCQSFSSIPSTATFFELVADRSLRWLVRVSTEAQVDEEEMGMIMKGLAVFIRKTHHELKSSLTETALIAIVKEKLGNVAAVECAIALIQTVKLKPLVVNRILQSTIQHPDFYSLCAASCTARGPILNLVHILFHIHPGNTCQFSHVEPLLSVYNGTLAFPDRKILDIFHLFETTKNSSLGSLLGNWSTSSLSPNGSLSAFDTIRKLDPLLVLRTALRFPSWRTLNKATLDHKVPEYDPSLYDPVFILLLCSQMFASATKPIGGPAWVEFFRTNVPGLLIRAASSRDDALREVAISNLAKIWGTVQEAEMQEKPQALYILNQFRNTLSLRVAINDRTPPRLPTYASLLLFHAIRGIFYPSNFIYPLTSRFLLQRPEIDVSDVPMLFSMLFSGSQDDWKKERGWILRFLADGMTSEEDWKVLKRRHTWELLESMFQGTNETSDRALRTGVLDVLANLTSNGYATTSLVLKASILEWIEMQLAKALDKDEVLLWLRVLENILVAVDAQKVEKATSGEWRSNVTRCLLIIAEHQCEIGTTPEPANLHILVDVCLRVVMLPGAKPRSLSSLIERALEVLQQLEPRIESIPLQSYNIQKIDVPLPPHRAHTSHERPNFDTHDLYTIWGRCVETLWRGAIELEAGSRPTLLDALTPRLLIWRAASGEENSEVGELARREVLRNLGSEVDGR